MIRMENTRLPKVCACEKRPPYITEREVMAWLNTPESLAALAEARELERRPGRGARTRLEILRMLHS